MPNETHVQRVQLGCGTLISLRIIVIFFSRGSDTNDLKHEVRRASTPRWERSRS